MVPDTSNEFSMVPEIQLSAKPQPAPIPPPLALETDKPEKGPIMSGLKGKSFRCKQCDFTADAPIKIFHHGRVEHKANATWRAKKKSKIEANDLFKEEEKRVIERIKKSKQEKEKEISMSKVEPKASGTVEEKREYQRQWRAKLKAKGLTTKGKKPKRENYYARFSAAERKEYFRKQNARKRERQAALLAGAPVPNGNGHTTVAKAPHPPMPCRFCADCGAKLPTVEHKGKVLPMAVRFCPHCGYQMPIVGQ